MDEKERADTMALLARTRDEFLAAVTGVSDAQSVWKPAPDRWSILECAEHVAVAENGMQKLIAERAVAHSRSITPGRESTILATGADRSQKRVAPERSRPAGRFASLGEAVGAFAKGRGQTIEFIAATPQDLRAMDVQHASHGLITAQECLALLTMHPARHAAQIRELRDHPDFPAQV